ncbi:MAG TPA: glycoside hydrolase family 97 protein [Candidatus Alistipes intestinigallinarum]|uniref:Glycoside hydrolase family 97 protein n=1 Tax=Candidatus Alistipes intestinigallinarum TaxID=2838440 RepID=A0A9D2CDE6_9BACT|nr:glycoside hydrolase family 97 protein [Candidatus Alistipes intestinigallinarum]
MKQNLFRLAAVAAAISLISCSTDTAVTSPDGRIRTSVTLNEAGIPALQIDVDGEKRITATQLGLEADETNLASGFAIAEVSRTRHDETWTQPWGENKQIRDCHEEMAVKMRNAEGVTLVLRVRAFDDGVGFRYEYDTPVDSLRLTDEHTTFRFAQDGLSWSIDGNYDTYELPYREQAISAVERANTPFTFRCGDLYGSIHEAALYDYPEMHLLRRDSLAFKAELAPLPDGVKARLAGRFTTPWRSVQIADRAVNLINSSLILNLNEPSKITDTSWIRPQKYVGVWWGMHLGTQVWTMGPRHGATTENAIRHIDFAAANNIQGVLFEGWNRGWENWGGNQQFDYVEPYADFDLERIAAYAAEKGIELWMHNETGGNIPDYEANMERAMKRYAELGIHTLKTGYAGGFRDGYSHHSQYGVQHYQRVVELAAKYHIMLDVHEPIKETGIRRTWPNMMTREGARGMEWNAWSEGNSAEYLCTLPFVRLLSGPMDYTPGIFDIYYDRAKADPGRIQWNGDNSQCCIKTTLARQIANWVIIYSPLQMAADLIENYEGHPAFRFFRDFDADCDWSEALQGEIGDYIVVARRAGERFFLGAGTNAEARTIDQPLGFLQPGVTYTARIYADDVNSPLRTAYRIEERQVTAADSLRIEMAPAGGCAVSFEPVQK